MVDAHLADLFPGLVPNTQPRLHFLHLCCPLPPPPLHLLDPTPTHTSPIPKASLYSTILREVGKVAVHAPVVGSGLGMPQHVLHPPPLSPWAGPDASRSRSHTLLAPSHSQGKVPKGLNEHLFLTSPFQRLPSQRTGGRPLGSESLEELRALPIKAKSEAYLASGWKGSVAPAAAAAAATSPSADKGDAAPPRPLLTDIPLPLVIRRHLRSPSTTLAKEVAAGKIAGYRIEVNGRRGSRSVKSVVSYGRLASKDLVGSGVDFARSHFVTKRGSTGVKVWIAYGQ
jgi:hypothetical protein